MPIDYKNYPANWRAISWRLRRERAGNQCEWCGAKNHAIHPETGAYVVLTVAHLGIDKPDGTPGDKTDLADCREENLAALCQRCHLNYDRPEHWQTRWRKRRAARIERGERMLFVELETETA